MLIPQFRNDRADRLPRGVEAEPGVDDEIGPAALLGVGHLQAKDALELAPFLDRDRLEVLIRTGTKA